MRGKAIPWSVVQITSVTSLKTARFSNEFGEYAEPVNAPYAAWESVEQAAAFSWPNPDWFDYETLPALCARYPDLALAAGNFGVQDFINGVAFGRGVNVTLGLPIVRTSVDHGTAFDIAGRGIANPYGTIWSGALMLEHLGETQAASQIMKAMDRAAAEGVLSADVGGKATTAEIARRVADCLDVV